MKGSVRYNADGLFNQSPDKRRLGTRPDTLRKNFHAISALLHKRAVITAQDYREVLDACQPGDIVYMDPPYQGVCGDCDSRYYSGIAYDDFVRALDTLNRRGIRYLISYDGRLGTQSYRKPLPPELNLTLVETEVGRFTQATLLGRAEITVESLYLSRPLAMEITWNQISIRRS